MASFGQAISSIVSETFKNILLRIGIYNGGTNDEIVSENTEQWQHYGFASRPLDANENGCHEPLLVNLGNKTVSIAERDNRGSKILGELSQGDSALYSAVGEDAAVTVKCCADKKIYISVPTELDSNGGVKKAHNIVMDADSNAITIAHAAGAMGPSLTLLENKAVLAMGPSTYIELTPTGINLVGATLNLYGMTAGFGPLKGTPTIV